MPFVIC